LSIRKLAVKAKHIKAKHIKAKHIKAKRKGPMRKYRSLAGWGEIMNVEFAIAIAA
jgi:hypothetical protein